LIKTRKIQASGIIDYFSAKDAQLAHPGGLQPHDEAQHIVFICTRRSAIFLDAMRAMSQANQLALVAIVLTCTAYRLAVNPNTKSRL
jgi:hypothetical protein